MISVSLGNVEFASTVLLVLSLPFSETLKTISIFLIAITLFLQVLKKELKIELSLLEVGFILLLLSGLLTSIFADNPAKSFKGAKDILFYTIPLFVASTLTEGKQHRVLIWSLYISTAIATVFGIVASIQSHRVLEIHALGNSNYNAMFFIMVISSMISTLIFSEKEGKIHKAVLGLLSVLLLAAAIMTEMRTSFLAFFSFLVILFFAYRQNKSVKFIVPAFIILMISFLYFYTPIYSKFLEAHSFRVRLVLWEHALTLFRENLAIGIGLNHFSAAVPDYLEKGSSYFDAHSVYLQTASQMGVFGLISLLLIVVGFLSTFIKLRAATGLANAVRYSALGGFLVIFAGGMFDTTLHHEHAIAFTVLTGLMLGLYAKHKKETPLGKS